jgi:hypothetical protein
MLRPSLGYNLRFPIICLISALNGKTKGRYNPKGDIENDGRIVQK